MPVINMDELNEIMDNDSELIEECFAEFLIDYTGLISQIKSAIDGKNYQEIDNLAHKLKGSLRYLAAENAANAAQILETAGTHQDLEDIDHKLSLLEEECQKVVLYIDEFSP